jgi:WD40 repeat protein/serine/threonine protein kinase
MSVSTKKSIKGYILAGIIGQSQYSTVYHAIQPDTNRKVVIKRILPEYANRLYFIRHFDVKYRLITRLNHPNIVSLYDYWREPDGAYFIMDYFSSNLRTMLADAPLALDEVSRLVNQITNALSLTHRSGIVHRNIKPNNILIDDNNNYCLTDFGISNKVEITLPDDLPTYLAPEQVSDASSTTKTDIYSLGIVLYEALTGKSAISGESLPLLQEINPGLPPELDDVIKQATAQNPDDRYSDALKLADAFREILTSGDGIIIQTPPVDPDVTQEAKSVADTAEKIASTALEEFIKGSGGIRWRFERETENPFKGLSPFEETDAVDFFGREALTEQLIARLTDKTEFSNFLTVVGPSGSGKSSVVKAGVISALRKGALPGSDNWFIIEMTPKSNPFDELEAALLSIAAHHPSDIIKQLEKDDNGLTRVVDAILAEDDVLVLVIDQFEEVFTLVDSPQQTKRFLQMILDAVTTPQSRIRIIVTLRADFYDRPLMHPDFCDLVSERTEVVSPLTPGELERAISAPLARISVNLEPELIPTIVAELKEQPGTLPMLQYALTELFERRDGQTITMAAYNEIGGIMGALTRRSDQLYENLDDNQQETVRQLFLRLVTLGEGTEDTRRQALQSELLSLGGAVMQEVIDLFGTSRLLTFDHISSTREPTVEVAHEAIIREWGKLHEWLDESRDDIRLQRMLASAAKDWREANHDKSYLLAGARLTQFEAWSQSTDVVLAADETSFLKSSITEEHRRMAKQQLIRNAALAITAMVVLLFAFMALFAFDKQGKAQDSANQAETQAAIAQEARATSDYNAEMAVHAEQEARDAERESEQSAATSHESAVLTNSQLALYRDNDTDLAIALALEAVELGNLHDQEFRVLSETMYSPGTRHVFTGHEDTIDSSDLNRDGTLIVSSSKDTTIRLWDVQTGEELRRFEGHTDLVRNVTFSPDESLIASASFDGTAVIWDVVTGEVIHTLENLDVHIMDVAFHPDGHLLATCSHDQTIKLWDVETGELVTILGADDPDTEEREGHQGLVYGVEFSPDGRYILSSGVDKFILQWDWEDETIVRQYEFSDSAYDVYFSPDSKTFFSSALENETHLWDLESGERLLTLKGHTAAIFRVDFSPDGETVLTSSQDGSIRLWNLETGAEIHRFIGHSDYVYDVEFLPNGTQFISSSYDSTLRLWDIETDETSLIFDGHDSAVYQVLFNSDGTQMLSVSKDQTIHLWDTQTGELIRIFGPDSPDTEEIEGHSNRAISVAYSPDEKFIISGGYDNVMHLWDVETGELLRTFGPDNPDTDEIEGHKPSTDEDTLPIWFVQYSPDGKTAFSASFDETIIQWDIDTGEIIRIFGKDDLETDEIEGHLVGVLGVNVLSDGKRILTHAWDNTIILWDVETGEIIHQYLGHDNWLWNIAISPDEKTFISASADSTMILWDIESGEIIRHFLGHEDSVLSVDFSPDGKWVVSAGRDGLVTLWNIETGDWLRHFRGNTNWVRAIDYSPVADVFVTGDSDGSIILWDMQTMDAMIDWAQQNRYVRKLTCEERELFNIEPYCEKSADTDES